MSEVDSLIKELCKYIEKQTKEEDFDSGKTIAQCTDALAALIAASKRDILSPISSSTM